MQRNILKDTLLLTIIQMLLDGLGLLLNIFMTKYLGTEAIGILTLTSSFFRLLAVIANGNVFLCASRFISEELGKQQRNPRKILMHCMAVSLLMCVIVSGIVNLFAKECSIFFLQSDNLITSVRIMTAALPLLTITSCIKGWFNACCQTAICAISDVIDCIARTICMGIMIGIKAPTNPQELCHMTIMGTIAGTMASLLLMLCSFRKCHAEATGKASLTWKQYLILALPVMGGSALTSFLSSANDALVPMTLRQAGNSASEAFSQFGIFEAIIIPTLFFPSTILCSLAGILVTETAREKAANHSARITELSEKTIRQTIVFAVFITVILLRFGDEIGVLLGGGEIAGKMIVLLAPVVPFIYLEIVSESIIKGIGEQNFSSVNYLLEYVIRISFVLIFIPLMGFYGIVLSYYASNIFGNVGRIVLIVRKTGMNPEPVKLLGIPLFSAICSSQFLNMIFLLLHIHAESHPIWMIIYSLFCCGVYLLIQRELFKLYGVYQESIFCKP